METQTSYVSFDRVKAALEQVIQDEDKVLEVIELLNTEPHITELPTDTTNDEVIQEVLDTTEVVDDTPPRIKQQFVVLVSDPNNTINNVDLTGWVLQIPENESPVTVVDRIKKAAYNFNASNKGQKHPVKTIGEAIESVKTKFHKAYDLKIKTKEPVLVILTDNKLPRE